MNAIATLDIAPDAPCPPLDDEPLFEIVDGRRVEVPRKGALSTLFASKLVTKLNHYGEDTNRGQAIMEGLFRLALPVERNRRPDVAFVTFERWPKDKMQGLDQNAWEVSPDLAVEVISKHDEVEPLLTKIEEYFAAKVRLVWVMFPKKSLIYVYDSFTQVRIFTRSDVLDGGPVLPDFRLLLADFFPAAVADLPTSVENEG